MIAFNRLGRFPSALAAALFALLSACADAEPPPALTIGDVGIPEDAITNLAERERAILADLIGFGAAVANERTDTLLSPVVRREAEANLIAALPLYLGAEAIGVSDDELRAAYARNPEWELVVRHVVRLVEHGDPPAVGDSARAVAAMVWERASAREDFGQLAAEFSEEPGAAERGGRLEPGRRGSWVEPFWQAASQLEVGEVSGVVESEYGFHVLRLDERRPVPFEEADRTAILRSVVPPQQAAQAMETWASSAGGILVDPPAIPEIRRALEAGSAIPDTLMIARGASGGEYRGGDFASGWARLPPEERIALEGADDQRFVSWILEDARGTIWASQAREMGIEPSPDAISAARLRWQSRLLGWAAALDFGPGLSDDQIRNAALQGLLSGAPEARIARAEIRSFRPILRAAYPVVSVES